MYIYTFVMFFLMIFTNMFVRFHWVNWKLNLAFSLKSRMASKSRMDAISSENSMPLCAFKGVYLFRFQNFGQLSKMRYLISTIKNCKILALECFLFEFNWTFGAEVMVDYSKGVQKNRMHFITIHIHLCVKTLTLQFLANLLKNIVWSNNCNLLWFFFL